MNFSRHIALIAFVCALSFGLAACGTSTDERALSGAGIGAGAGALGAAATGSSALGGAAIGGAAGAATGALTDEDTINLENVDD